MFTQIVYGAVGLVGLAVMVLAVSFAWSSTHPHRISTSHEFAATPEQVWEVLVDNDAYLEWNPSIIRSSGDFVVGQRVHNVVRTTDGTMDFRPVVLTADPGRELRWIGRLYLPGLADGEHSFVIEDLGDGRVRLTQEETFRGAIVPFAGSALDLKSDFDAVNVALAQRVSERFASHG